MIYIWNIIECSISAYIIAEFYEKKKKQVFMVSNLKHYWMIHFCLHHYTTDQFHEKDESEQRICNPQEAILNQWYNKLNCHHFITKENILYSLVWDLFSRNLETSIHTLNCMNSTTARVLDVSVIVFSDGNSTKRHSFLY